MNVERVIRNYLLGLDLETKKVNIENVAKDDKFVSKKKCFKEDIERIFDCNISCNLYNQVVNGEGSEKDKITSVYSSSLQSLLFFSQVSDENKLTVNIDGKNIEFERVQFEYKNKVINSPSSVDVVLSDMKGENILFIESKLSEIARDSKKKKEDETMPGKRVVGISYFFKEENSGYFKALSLKNADELKKIGIIFPEDEVEYPIDEKKRENKGKNDALVTLPSVNNANNEYVYSYGVKQILSHIIGILNFRNGSNAENSNCSNELRTYEKNANVYFMELYNGFPMSMVDDVKKQDKIRKINHIQDEFKKHVEVVFKVLREKNLDITMLDMTYQELYKNRGCYEISDEVVRFYHLDE